jgi:hypothetical protein
MMVSCGPHFGAGTVCAPALSVKPNRKTKITIKENRRRISKNTNQKIPIKETGNLLKTLFRKA